jgi:hypothetical protein
VGVEFSSDLVMFGGAVNPFWKLFRFNTYMLNCFSPNFYSVFDCFSPSESGAGTELELGGDDGRSASASAAVKWDAHSGRWYISHWLPFQSFLLI